MIKCGYFDSKDRDRLYKAEDMSRPYELLISNGVFATQQGTASDYLQVYANGDMTVTVKPGRGIFKDKWLINDTELLLTLDASEVTLTRIDSIIVRIDTSEAVRAGTIEVKKGEPSSSPSAPAMERTEDVYEYRLADITIGPQTTAIEQLNIRDQRGSADCPWVTSLVQQVDTSTLWAQWQDAFDKYYADNETRFDSYDEENRERFDIYYDTNEARFNNYYDTNEARFDEYFEELMQTVSGKTLVRSYSSYHVATTAGETVIPINISQYDSALDVLQVYINGFMAIQGLDYTVGDAPATEVTLTKGVDAGTIISFVILKSIDGSEAQTVVEQVATLEAKVAELEARIAALE